MNTPTIVTCREVEQPQRHGQPVLASKTFDATQPYLTVLYDAALRASAAS